MNKLFGKLPAATAAILVAASFAMVSNVDAAGGGRGGGGGGGGGGRGGGGGGGAQAGGGGGGARAAQGGGRQNAQVDNSRADTRTNNTRSTSVNNVNNVNVERNVNVSGNNGCCNGGWDNDYHPVATAAAITATAAVVGSIVRAPPPGCAPVNYGGVVYQQCGSTWYAPQGSQFAVVAPPY
jgi:hypothetical protein